MNKNEIMITTDEAKNDVEVKTEDSVDVDTKNAENTDPGVYVHKLKKPFQWEGVTYEEITFNFNGLTGMDLENVETELAAQGHFVANPEFNTRYAYKIAAKAAGIHCSVIEHLPIYDANTIRRAVKDFLLYGD